MDKKTKNVHQICFASPKWVKMILVTNLDAGDWYLSWTKMKICSKVSGT